MAVNLILLILGFVLLIKGADFLLKGATTFSKITHVPELIVGILLVGIGTSLPEIILTIKSSLSGNTDLILGNAIGSSICNFLLVLGIACVTKPIKLDLKTCELHLVILAISIVVLGVLSNYVFDIGYLDKKEGYILLAVTIIYLIINIKSALKQEDSEDKDKSKNKQVKEKIKVKEIIGIIINIIVGVVFLNYGADFVINSSKYIAECFRISAEVISLTIIAAGTALPEIITSIIASKNHNNDLVMGNIIGSNVFNTVLLPALGAIIAPIEFGVNLNNSLLFLGVLTTGILIRFVGFEKDVISKRRGLAFIIIYFVYITTLIV